MFTSIRDNISQKNMFAFKYMCIYINNIFFFGFFFVQISFNVTKKSKIQKTKGNVPFFKKIYINLESGSQLTLIFVSTK